MHDRQHRVVKGQVDLLTLAAPLALDQGKQDPLNGVQTGEIIRDSDADPGGLTIRKAGDIHQPGFTLNDDVVAGTLRSRTVLSVAADRAIHQPGVDRGDLLIAEPERRQAAGAKVLHQHIRRLNQPLEDVATRSGLQVERDTLLASVDGAEIRARSLDQWWPRPRFVAVPGLLDLQDLGSHVAEQHGAERTGENACQIDDADALQWRDGFQFNSIFI